MFLFQSIKQYHQELSTQKTSCVDAVSHYLNKIAENKHLNAFVEKFAEEAILKAKQLDEKRQSGLPIGKLHGVVVAIKDVICYKDHKVTAASKILENFTASYNASCVQYLLDEEAIIIGTTNCDEFAMGSSNENSVYGKVLNAKDNTKIPGGSSGGSAVDVQADLCMISLGSDTGGSVRQPADFCGIIGLKPSYGCISRYGLIAYASSFDQIGIFGKNIDDVTLALEVISKVDDFDSTMNQQNFCAEISTDFNEPAKKYKIAIFKDVMHQTSLDKEIKENIFNTIASLKELGHEFIEMDFKEIEYVVPTYYVLTTAEASSNLSRYDGIKFGHTTTEPVSNLNDYYIKNRTEGFGMEVKKRILLGNFVLSSGYYDAYFQKAQQVRQMLVNKTTEIFKNCDAILMPTSPGTAFAFGEKKKDPIEMYLADIFTVFANLTGIPAVALPLYQHSNGMPFGLQILTNRNEEKKLISISDLLLNQ